MGREETGKNERTNQKMANGQGKFSFEGMIKEDPDSFIETKKSGHEICLEIGGQKTTPCFNRFQAFKIKIFHFFNELFNKIYCSKLFTKIIIFAYIFSLVINPLRSIIFPKYFDWPFNIVNLFVILVFATEIITFLFHKKNYFLSFYFFIDLISTLLIVFDLTFVYYPLFYQNEDTNDYAISIRLFKILRILRLVRIVKLTTKLKKELKIQLEPKKKELSELHITKILKESNSQKLIVLILIVLIVIPFFETSFYVNKNNSDLFDKVQFIIPMFLRDGFGFKENIEQLQGLFKEQSSELIFFKLQDNLWDEGVFKSLRNDEWNRLETIYPFKGVLYSIEIIISNKYKSIIYNLLMLLDTFLVITIMVISIYTLNKELGELILNPLERMIQKVRSVKENPLSALKDKNSSGETDRKNEMNETLVIETAIDKISRLLLLGFGQAGCKIITNILADQNSDYVKKSSGVKVKAIFGFCDIRQFTDTTEILLEDVMVFVNTIAEIVHTCVDKCGGAANKNIGDAFLLVWKLYKEEAVTLSFKELNPAIVNMDEKDIAKTVMEFNSNQAEMALLSYIKIIININTYPNVLKYSLKEEITDKIPDYRVTMGFGLHEGWAIEGAIGSGYKIDASYLSPNVNLASRLEAATKQFNVEILISGNIYKLLRTKQLKSLCRHIDTVTVKGSIQPIKLYTIDLNIPALYTKGITFYKAIDRKSVREEKIIKLKEEFRRISQTILTNDFKINDLENLLNKNSIEEETKILKTLNEFDYKTILNFEEINMENFRDIFAQGVKLYLEGDWKLARDYLIHCLEVKSNDGPTLVLINFMEKYDFTSPENWKNCRDLTDK